MGEAIITGPKIIPATVAPLAAGTAAVGTSFKFARQDHVHPLQTTVSGNAGSATKLATARTIRTNLASTSTASFNGTANITPGVTGILPVANGGTGVDSLEGLANSLTSDGAIPNFVVGTYTGNGKCTYQNPSTLTFSFAPSVVIIFRNTYNKGSVYYYASLALIMNKNFDLTNNTSYALAYHPILANSGTAVNMNSDFVHFEFMDDNSIKWYADNTVTQCSTSKKEYIYIAF